MPLRVATEDDYYRFYGKPARWPLAAGYVEDRGYMLDGIGGIYRRDAAWWVCLDRAPGVKVTRAMIRAARDLMAFADEHGLVLHALADPRITGADVLLRGLGFVETDEADGDTSLRIWKRGA